MQSVNERGAQCISGYTNHHPAGPCLLCCFVGRACGLLPRGETQQINAPNRNVFFSGHVFRSEILPQSQGREDPTVVLGASRVHAYPSARPKDARICTQCARSSISDSQLFSISVYCFFFSPLYQARLRKLLCPNLSWLASFCCFFLLFYT